MCNLAINKSWPKQSNAFDRSVNKAQKTLLLSVASFQVSSITNKQCSHKTTLVRSFQKVLKSGLLSILSNNLDNIGRMLTGLWWFFEACAFFLKSGVIFANLRQGNLPCLGNHRSIFNDYFCKKMLEISLSVKGLWFDLNNISLEVEEMLFKVKL